MTRQTETSAPREAIEVAASIAYLLSAAAERGEWDFSPAMLHRLLLELGNDCLEPDGPTPEAAVQDFVRVWSVGVGRII